MKHLLIILSILLLSSPLFGQSKPLGVVLPPTIIGTVSKAREQILLNTLDEEVSKYFDVSPSTNDGSGKLPVVSDVFQLQIVEEDGDTQLSLRWNSGNERKVETILCIGCKTIQLNGKLEELVVKMFGGKKKESVAYKEKRNNSESIVRRTINYTDGRKYVGGLKDAKPNGYGVLTYPDGAKYEGGWKDGEEHGNAKLTVPNGSYYVGEFFNGKIFNGKTYDINGNLIHKFVNGKEVQVSKNGVLFNRKVNGNWGWYKNGNENSHGKYVGEIKNAKPNGQGIYIHPAGFKYEGEYKDGDMHGTGKLTYDDGEMYQGEFQYDKLHGKGYYYFEDGRYMVGEWLGGEPWNAKGFDKNGKLTIIIEKGLFLN